MATSVDTRSQDAQQRIAGSTPAATVERQSAHSDQRARVDFDVDTWMTNGGLRTYIKARAMNLSDRGMLLNAPAPLPLGARIDIRFVSAPGAAPIVVLGEVEGTVQSRDHGWLCDIHLLIVRKSARLGIRDAVRTCQSAVVAS